MNRFNLKLRQQINEYIDILTPVIDLNLLDTTIEENYKLKCIELNTLNHSTLKYGEFL